MCPLNVYYQLGHLQLPYEDFKNACSQSNYDIICVAFSLLWESTSDEEVVDTDIFDIFRLHRNYSVEPNREGVFVAVRKHLSAYARSEWQTEGFECLWVTVPSCGCRNLHIACGFFDYYENLDPFVDTLTSLNKMYLHDKFLITGGFPISFCDYMSILSGQDVIENELLTKLNSYAASVGLKQYNEIKNELGYLYNHVFSSVPITILRCPHPLYPEDVNCELALQFELNISLSECCKTANDATEECRMDASSGQRDMHQDGLNASRLLEKMGDELIKEKFEQIMKEPKFMQDEYSKMSEENVSFNSECEALRSRITDLEVDSKLDVNIAERLQMLEERTVHSDRAEPTTTGAQTDPEYSRAIREILALKDYAAPAIEMEILSLNNMSIFPPSTSQGQQGLSFGQFNESKATVSSEHTRTIPLSQSSISSQNASGGTPSSTNLEQSNSPSDTGSPTPPVL